MADVKTTIDSMVKKGLEALQVLATFDQEKVDYIVAKMSVAGLDHHGNLAKLAIEETGRGVFEDKATKNLFACEYVVNNMRHLKTAGIIDENPVTGITTIAEPVGVICGVTPVTNPTSTVIFKCLIALKTRNPIIFGFHPKAQKCSKEAAIVMRDAAIKAGAPENCIQWIEEPSIDATRELMTHPDVATILATGGPGMVKAAYTSGKPALGVGPGNVPVYVDKTANIDRAVNDIYLSKSFDNGMICASESVAIVHQDIYKEFVKKLKEYTVYFATKEEQEKLADYMFKTHKGAKNVKEATLNGDVAGMDAVKIAKNAGFDVPANTKVIAVTIDEIGENEPLSKEKLCSVLGIIKAKDEDEGLKLSEELLEFGGLGHSAAIHSQNEDLVKKFGDKMKAIRIIWNSPSTFGGIGNIYNSFLPSLTLGCGTYGGNSVGGNVSAVNLINYKQIGKRRNTMK